MDTNEWFTRWSVRVALACYVLGLALRTHAGGEPSRLVWARLAWTGGFLAFLVHVTCAFHFYHAWSHHAAYEATARDTAAVVGLAWGGGLYANYAFALVWGADAAWWWLRPAGYLGRPRGVEMAVQGFLAFIAFNATVVFGKGAIRWAGLAACVFLATVLGYAVYRRRAARGR